MTVGTLFSVTSYTPGEKLMFLATEVLGEVTKGVRFQLQRDGRSAKFVMNEERETARLTQRVGSVRKHVLKTLNVTGSVTLTASDIQK